MQYFDARYYRNTWGRFTTVDPVPGKATDPQSFNRYAYAKNNPLKFIDPDGLYPRPVVQAEQRVGATRAASVFVTCTNAPARKGGCAERAGDQTGIVITTTAAAAGSAGGLLGGSITVLGVSMTPLAAGAAVAVAGYAIYQGVKALIGWFASEETEVDPSDGYNAAEVRKELNAIGTRKSSSVREASSPEEANEFFEKVTQGRPDVTRPGYDGVQRELADGTIIGKRNASKSTGEIVIDIRTPGKNGVQLKLHVPKPK